MSSVHRARVMNPVTVADLRRIAAADVVGAHNVRFGLRADTAGDIP